MKIDSRTPVVVGAGQVSERLDQPGYRRRSAADLAGDAARAALADCGGRPAAVAEAIDTVAGVRQFEISLPGAEAPLGRSANFPRSVAARLGANPRRAVLEVVGGQAPQRLVNEFAAAIAAGTADVVLLAGGEAISTAERFTGRPDAPDFTENPAGGLEDRGLGLDGIVSLPMITHGLTDTTSQYALIENARRSRIGLTRSAYAAAMGALFAPLSRVAAGNPHAAAPVARTAAELAAPSEANRPIADPYTRYLVAREKVNQGAAVLLMSAAAADRLGVPDDRRVFLHGHADLRERDLLHRHDYDRSPAAAEAARHALEVAGITVADLTTIDLYSCYPAPVFLVAEALGLTADDPRGLTVTGGLPFFGGPGNNYSMHAIAETVRRVRSGGGYGFVGANGGILSKYSAGVYSALPREWTSDESGVLQAGIDALPAAGVADEAYGKGVIETWTVKHRRDGSRTGIVLGRLAEGRRFVAHADPEVMDLLLSGEPAGAEISVRPDGFRNVVSDRRRARAVRLGG